MTARDVQMTTPPELSDRRAYIGLLAEFLRRYPYLVPRESWLDDPGLRFDAAAHERLRGRVDDAITRLDVREQEVLQLRHGLLPGGRVWTYTEIEVKWGVSTTRIRQILERAYWKLRRSGGLDGFMDALDPTGGLRTRLTDNCGVAHRAS